MSDQLFATLVEIYGLYDPRDGMLRYIGKANVAQKRLKSHIRESRHRSRPVCQWIAELISANLLPEMRVLATVPHDSWKEWERREIAAARARGENLLNIAPGGDQPFCPESVRAANGQRNAAARVATPAKREIYELKRDIGLALKKGWVRPDTKAKLRAAAIKWPHLFGEWASL